MHSISLKKYPSLLRVYILSGFILLLPFLLQAQGLQEIPKIDRFVNDFTGTLSESDKQVIESKLRAFEASKGSQIVVLMVNSTKPEAIEQYGIRVAEKTKAGREGVDDGLLLLVALDDRSMRIEVGYGLEGVVPDAIAKRIISNILTPAFREGKFGQGINQAVDALIALVQEEELPPAIRQTSRAIDPDRKGSLLFMLLGAALLVGTTFVDVIFKNRFNGKVRKVITFFIALAAGWLFFNIIAGLMMAIFILIFSVMPKNGGSGGGGYYGGGRHYRGGGFGGFSGGGGGFGGFSGGGGGFGGGGASGRW